MLSRASLLVSFVSIAGAQTFTPKIPRAWDGPDVSTFETPLAQRDRSPKYLSADEYYAQRVRPIYRGYPVYLPGREPAGYIDSLKQKDPEVIFDPAALHTEQDWIRAGELVFDAPNSWVAIGAAPFLIGAEAQRDIPARTTRDGILPWFQYVVRRKGLVELGLNGCAECHTRVMDDGTIVKAAQGNFPFDQRQAWSLSHRPAAPEALEQERQNIRSFYWAPWIMGPEDDKGFTREGSILRRSATPSGVSARQGTSTAYPVRIPSLLGVRDIRFLDSTGLVRHRSLADLMRYAIVNVGLDIRAHYGDYQPKDNSGAFAEVGTRYSDEQLYALALYLYSLKPPPNPNSFDAAARRGERIFRDQGCAGCHAPPVYTINKLTPALGFQVPDDLKGDVLNISVGTDPSNALRTRRGTGFYKIPSLRGVWMRNGFGHNGQAYTLEEWLDPARLTSDFVPTGFHLGPGPVRGHEFGLKLSPADRAALISFLRTL